MSASVRCHFAADAHFAKQYANLKKSSTEPYHMGCKIEAPRMTKRLIQTFQLK